jgi:hypothetical protein
LVKVREKLHDKSLFQEAFQSLHDIVYLKTQGSYEERIQAVQQELEQFKATYARKEEDDLVAYISQRWEPKKEMWMVSLRDGVNHRDHNTTSVAEGWHSSVKGWVRSTGSENLRIDHLIYFLLENIGRVFEHKDTRRCDEAARNKAAEKCMTEVVKKAAAVDMRRFVAQGGLLSNGEGGEHVDVLQTDLQSKAYTMCGPSIKYAACTCATGMHRTTCKHQVAWLVALAPAEHRPAAERLCVQMLGTRLGFTGRANMEDISSLTAALCAQHQSLHLASHQRLCFLPLLPALLLSLLLPLPCLSMQLLLVL